MLLATIIPLIDSPCEFSHKSSLYETKKKLKNYRLFLSTAFLRSWSSPSGKTSMTLSLQFITFAARVSGTFGFTEIILLIHTILASNLETIVSNSSHLAFTLAIVFLLVFCVLAIAIFLSSLILNITLIHQY